MDVSAKRTDVAQRTGQGAILLLHGLGGTPFEVEPLAAPLRKLGLHVEIPLLPGHGTCLEEFKRTFYPDWREYAFEAFQVLQKLYSPVFVAGFSMGGAIALEIAASFPVAGVITLAAPQYVYRLCPRQLRDWRVPFVGILKYIYPYPSYRKAKPESRAIAPFQGYEGVLCLPQLHSMVKGFYPMRRRLHSITCPALIMHDLRDTLVHPANALGIAKAISSADVTLRYTAIRESITSHHLITTHKETTEEVSGQVTSFVRRLLPA